MSHNDKTMVCLRTGLSFAWLDKTLNKELKKIVGVKGRTSFIKESAMDQFKIRLESSSDFIPFDRIIKEHHYQDRADWLRDICRKKINQKECIKIMGESEDIRELLVKEIDYQTYIEALKGTVDDLKAALYTISLADDIKIANEIAEQMLSDFYNADEHIKETTLEKEKEIFRKK